MVRHTFGSFLPYSVVFIYGILELSLALAPVVALQQALRIRLVARSCIFDPTGGNTAGTDPMKNSQGRCHLQLHLIFSAVSELSFFMLYLPQAY